jgi:hypothetical protein
VILLVTGHQGDKHGQSQENNNGVN